MMVQVLVAKVAFLYIVCSLYVHYTPYTETSHNKKETTCLPLIDQFKSNKTETNYENDLS